MDSHPNLHKAVKTVVKRSPYYAAKTAAAAIGTGNPFISALVFGAGNLAGGIATQTAKNVFLDSKIGKKAKDKLVNSKIGKAVSSRLPTRLTNTP